MVRPNLRSNVRSEMAAADRKSFEEVTKQQNYKIRLFISLHKFKSMSCTRCVHYHGWDLNPKLSDREVISPPSVLKLPTYQLCIESNSLWNK